MRKQGMNCVRDAMKARFSKTMAGMVLAIMFAVAAAQVSLSADEEQERNGIEGVWDVAVTIRQCDSGTPVVAIHAMNMFIQGGTLTETSNSPLRSSSLGTWRRISRHGYTAVFRFFTFNADGSFAGRNKITRTIKLSADGNRFSANAVFEDLDIDDHLVASGCATETAQRLED
jgi:hypothetical protein